MHKVVIVDDDRIIRKGLSSVIQWNKYGFELVGLAADGAEGLDIIKATNPEIVISDIRMPFMDGLEMMKAVRKFNSRTKIILLTGYQDFKYAHEAIKLKAFHFLLKPVETSDLIEKLEQAALEIESEKQMDSQMFESQQYRQQQFLKRLSLMPLNNAEMASELTLNGIQPTGSWSAALVVKLNQPHIPSQMGGETIKTNIMEDCREYIKTVPSEGYVLNDEAEFFTIFLFGNSLNKEAFAQSTADLAKKILRLIKNKYPSTATITIGRVYKPLAELRCSYLEALKAMKFRHIMGINSTYSIEDIEACHGEERGTTSEVEQKLIKYITLGLPEKVMDLLGETKSKIIKNKSMTLQETVLQAIRIINVIGYESSKVLKNPNEDRLIEVENKLITMQNIDEIFIEMEQMALEMTNKVKRINRDRKHSLVKKAIAFIHNNYHRSNLNLQTVADEVHVSYAYLSNLFKVELGFNFGDILLETRMSKAIELFQQSDLKTYEVAERTGYSNSNYFSSSFKKYTGFSPAEFKKINNRFVRI